MEIHKIFDNKSTGNIDIESRQKQLDKLKHEIKQVESNIRFFNQQSWKALDQWLARNQVTSLEWVDKLGRKSIKHYPSVSAMSDNVKDWMIYVVKRNGYTVNLYANHIDLGDGSRITAIENKDLRG